MQSQGAQDEAKQGLEAMCNQIFSGQTATKCVNIVDQYFPLIWDELEALMSDAHAVCVDLEMCTQEVAPAAARRTNLVRLLPAMRRSINHSTLPARQTPRLDSSQRFLRIIQTRTGLTATCVICKIGFRGLIDTIRDGPIMPLLALVLRWGVCDKLLPADYKPGCNDFLHMYLKSVLVMTLDEITPTEVCDWLQLCKASDKLAIDQMSESQRGEALCEACTLTAQFMQHELSDPTLQDDIVHTVESVCNELDGDARKECDTLIETYLPAIFQSVSVELNPSKICPELNMCPAQRTPLVKLAKATNDNV